MPRISVLDETLNKEASIKIKLVMKQNTSVEIDGVSQEDAKVFKEQLEKSKFAYNNEVMTILSDDGRIPVVIRLNDISIATFDLDYGCED